MLICRSLWVMVSCVLLWVLMAQWASNQWGTWVFVREAYLAGAWWQLWTSQWVHLNVLHLGFNLLGLVWIVCSFDRWVTWRTQCIALVGGFCGVALAIALDVDCAYYAGLSGALHGLLVGNAVALSAHGRGHKHAASKVTFALGMFILMAVLLKLYLQRHIALPHTQGWLGVTTYLPAHEAGALGGLLFVGLYLLASRQWFAQCPTAQSKQ